MKKVIYSMIALATMTFALSSCEDVPAPYDDPNNNTNSDTIKVEPTGAGTVENPFNVAAANNYIKNSGDATAEVYVKGVISEISSVDPTYGNATYYISDNGSNTSKLEVYRGYYLGGKKFSSEDQISEGDTVVICGKLVNYNGTYEFTTGNYIYSLNGKTGSQESGGENTPSGEGTLTSPYNVAKAQSIISAGTNTNDSVYISGIVSKIQEISTQFGNATYYISDDGKTTGQLEVYRGYGLDGVKFTSDNDLKVGDKVIIKGVLTKYNSTPEVKTGSIIVSLNGKSSGGTTGGDTPSNGTINASGTTVTITNSAVTAGSTTVTIDLNTLNYANAESVSTVTLSDGSTIVFSANGENNGPKFYSATKGVRVYSNNTITFNGKSDIASIVLTCDTYKGTDYVGNPTATINFKGSTAVYTNYTSDINKSNVQLRVKTITITYAK